MDIQMTDEQRERLDTINRAIEALKATPVHNTQEEMQRFTAINKLYEQSSAIWSEISADRFEQSPDQTPEAVLERFMEVLPDICNEAMTQMRLSGEGMDENGLFDPNAVLRLMEDEIRPYLDYLQKHGKNNEFINAVRYLQNGLTDPYQFSSETFLIPLGNSYQSVSTSLSVPTGEALSADAPSQPTHLISPTDNVSNITFKPRPTIDLTDTEVNTYRGFSTVLSVAFEDDDVSISGTNKLTSYDRYVHDAICSLFVADNPHMLPRNITPAMIYRVIAAKPGSRVPPLQAAQIEATIEKLRRTNISIRETKNGGNDTQQISDHLISGTFGRRTFYGQTASVLRVNAVPVLFSYAATKKQISRAPIELFRIQGVSKYSQDFILTMQYLWRRISAMKGTSTLSRTIRMDSVYENVDLVPEEHSASVYANKKKAIRDHAKAILDDWKNNQGFIYDYSVKQKGRELVAYEIVLSRPKGIESESDAAREE